MRSLADQINLDAEEFRYFWAYGTLRDTLAAWPGNEYLLSETARCILESARAAA